MLCFSETNCLKRNNEKKKRSTYGFSVALKNEFSQRTKYTNCRRLAFKQGTGNQMSDRHWLI